MYWSIPRARCSWRDAPGSRTPVEVESVTCRLRAARGALESRRGEALELALPGASAVRIAPAIAARTTKSAPRSLHRIGYIGPPSGAGCYTAARQTLRLDAASLSPATHMPRRGAL